MCQYIHCQLPLILKNQQAFRLYFKPQIGRFDDLLLVLAFPQLAVFMLDVTLQDGQLTRRDHSLLLESAADQLQKVTIDIVFQRVACAVDQVKVEQEVIPGFQQS